MNAIVERYDRDAADYERYWAPVLRPTAVKMLDYVDDYVGFVERGRGSVRVLEVGAGTGTLLELALARWPNAKFIAADPAAAMVERARSRIAGGDSGSTVLAATERVEFVNAPAEALTLADGSVDLVISTFVLQLVPDRVAALREANRVLAPGGMVAYLTWLDRDVREPFRPADEFDEAVYDLDVDEPEGTDEPHAGDVHSARTATRELREAGFIKASAREEVLRYDWTLDGYLEYKLAYDERSLLDSLDEAQRAELERNVRDRFAKLKQHEFRWHAPVVFARAEKPRDG